MKVIAFITDYPVADRIIDHLKPKFVAERPPPPQVASQELLMAADPRPNISLKALLCQREVRVISGSSGRADGIRVACPRSPGVIDMFPALIYAFVRWRDGIIDAITRLQPAQQKTKYLWRKRIRPGLRFP